MASLGLLESDNAEKAITWLKAFRAIARVKSWIDDVAKKSYTITDNFMALCGLQALNKVEYILSPQNIEETDFETIHKSLIEYLSPKKRLVVVERAQFHSLTIRIITLITLQ